MNKEISGLYFHVQNYHRVQNTIMSIWSFKRKHFPDGRIMKHKAQLYAHGGMQK